MHNFLFEWIEILPLKKNFKALLSMKHPSPHPFLCIYFVYATWCKCISVLMFTACSSLKRGTVWLHYASTQFPPWYTKVKPSKQLIISSSLCFDPIKMLLTDWMLSLTSLLFLFCLSPKSDSEEFSLPLLHYLYHPRFPSLPQHSCEEKKNNGK